MFCWILAVKCLTVFSSICIVLFSDAGWSSMVARRAHNPKVVGSNPAPATKFSSPRFYRGFFLGLIAGVSESLYLKKVVWKLDVRVFRWLLFSIIFVDRVHATALVLSTNFVAWASPASHLRFQTTCPLIIFVGRTHATDTESAKTDRKFKYERSSETYIGFSDDLFVSIIFVDRVHATALVLPTNFVAWASPTNR